MALTINRNGQLTRVNTGDAGVVGNVFPLIREDETWAEVEIELGADEEKSSSLPLMATASDVREIVKFLRKKPGGVTVVEAVEAIKKPTLDPRKMTAYEYWGLVTRHGDRIRLSPRGWDFARKLEPETQAFRDLLCDTDLYRAALAWLRESQMELVTDSELADYWQRRHAQVVGAGNEKTVKANVACFFHLCQAAEFGSLTIGKRGQPTRLRVDQDELESYLTVHESGASQTPDETVIAAQPQADVLRAQKTFRARAATQQAARPRVFVSCPKGERAAAQIRAALELAEIESELDERDSGEDSALVAAGVIRAMRGCDAALVVVAPEDCLEESSGGVTLRRGVLNQINAACALYDGQVALVWSGGPTPACGLEALPRFELEGGTLTLERGIEIVKAAKAWGAGE
jgi:hypothetical protein